MLQIITEREDFKAIALEMMQLALQSLPGKQAEEVTEILTEQQLCERLSLSPQTLSKWRAKGKIPFFQIGSAIRYDFKKVLSAIEVSAKNKCK